MALSVLGGVVFLPLLWLQTIHKTDPDSGYIFPISFIIIILAVFLFDSSVSMLDACSLSISKKHGADFGRQKMLSIAGTATVPFACGYLIDLITEYKGIVICCSTFQLLLYKNISQVSKIIQLFST